MADLRLASVRQEYKSTGRLPWIIRSRPVAAEPQRPVKPSQIKSIWIRLVIPRLRRSNSKVGSLWLVQELDPEMRCQFQWTEFEAERPCSGENISADRPSRQAQFRNSYIRHDNPSAALRGGEARIVEKHVSILVKLNSVRAQR